MGRRTRHGDAGAARPRAISPALYDALFPSWGVEGSGQAPAHEAPPPSVAGPEPASPRELIEDFVTYVGNRALEWQCKRVLELLEKACPGLIPPGPVPAGEVTEPLDIGSDQLHDLVLNAAGVEDKRRRNQVIWEHAGSELLVHLKQTRVAVLDGYVLVGLVVETDETGRVEVTVPFAVGSKDRLAGMVVTTEPVPRGPTPIIDRWGDALIAWAWQLLTDVVGALTAQVGVDEKGTPLLPGAIVASEGKLRVIPQAPHLFESARR